MEKKMTRKELLLLASMIFGMFFGAGNLIFPAHLGQLAGNHWGMATIGFLISATLLPLAALLALAKTNSSGLYDFAGLVGKSYGGIFLIFVHLALGPLISTPRTAALGFEFSFAPFIAEKNLALGQFIFSGLFFLAAYLLALRESRLIKIIGKFLNPLFLILILGLFLLALLAPLGDLNFTPTAGYGSQALTSGFLEGYNTMDALAALAFGVTIIQAIKSFGIKRPEKIGRYTISAGLLAMLLCGGIYLGIILLGTMSLNQFSISENGGIALTQITQTYLGQRGFLVMGLLTLLAVFTTALGLITSFAQDFSKHFPILSYKGWLTVTTLLSFVTANFGLDTIITWTTPVLLILYPLAMALIFPALLLPKKWQNKKIYLLTTLFTLVPAFFDGLTGVANIIPSLKGWTEWYTTYFPLAKNGLGWVLPTFIGLILGLLLFASSPKKEELTTFPSEKTPGKEAIEG